MDQSSTVNNAQTQPEDHPTANQQAVEEMFQRIDNIHGLPTLSVVATKVLSLLQNIEVPAKDLVTVLENDQAIVPKLLRLVNSSFFGFSKKISNVQHAVMLLGYNTVRNAVLSVEVINAMQLKKQTCGFDLTEFWRHAVAVAVISTYLDEQTGRKYCEDVFTAGLIHDIGKIVMALYFTERFEQTWECMHQENLSFFEAEKRFFPLVHPEIGAQLTKKWNLSDRLQHVVARHHSGTSSNKDRNLVLIVHAADAMANQNADSENLNPEKWPICLAARESLENQINSVEQWMPDLEEQIQTACKVLMNEG